MHHSSPNTEATPFLGQHGLYVHVVIKIPTQTLTITSVDYNVTVRTLEALNVRTGAGVA